MLFGRGPECARIDRLLAEIRQGASDALVVSGEPGVGKTSLLDYARGSVSGLRVLSVTGAESEAVFPFAALGRLLVPVLAHLGTIPGRPAGALRGALALTEVEAGDRFAVCAGLFQVLSAAADQSPMLVVVDDAQWLDQPSAEAVAFVARRLGTEGIGLLIATREADGFAGLEVLPVAGLDEASVGELLTARSGTTPGAEVVRALAAQLSGNPLALTEVAGALSSAELAGSRPLRLPLPVERTAARIFGPRVARLDDESRRALQVAAVAAGDGLPVLSAASERLGIGRATLERLEDTGLVSFGQGRLEFVHPLVRTAAVVDLTPTQMRSLHRVVAGVLTVPAQQDRRAWHLAEAALGPDEEVACALEQAAQRARERSGYAAAVLLLERAADLSAGEDLRAQRLYAAADAARSAGQGDAALRLLTRSEAHTTDPGLRATVAGLRGRIEMRRGKAAAAHAVLHGAGTSIAGTDPARGGVLLAAAATAAFVAGDVTGAFQLAQDATALAAPGAVNIHLYANVIIGNALAAQGQVDESRRRIRAAGQLAQRTDSVNLDIDSTIFAALSMVWIGEVAEARTLLDPLVHRLRTEGALGPLPFALYVSALADSRRGRLTIGRSVATEAVDLAAGTGDLMTIGLASGCLALLEAQRGDEQACRTRAATSFEHLEDTNPADAQDALGLLELSLGRADRAVPHLEHANWGSAGGSEADVPVLARPSSIDLIEAYTRAGTAVPTGMLERLQHLTELDSAGPLTWRARALLADEQHSDEYFHRSLELHAGGGFPFDTARTQLCYGERLRRTGRRRDAREHLQTACETFQAIGARLWAQRAATELTAAGQPAKSGGHNAGDTLTAQELQVAQHAAGGSTNKEIAAQLFLSVKTIEMHLGRVYRKLGIRSRTQLANLLRDNQFT